MSMKQPIVRVLALVASVWAIAGVARADFRQESLQYPLPPIWNGLAAEQDHGRAANPYALYAQWGGVPPEQRQQMRQQMREHWQQMPPEQRESRRREHREQWQQLPSDERQRIRDEMREQRGGEGRHGVRGGYR